MSLVGSSQVCPIGENANQFQRQDKAKLLPGGSQTLIKVAEKYEEQKRKLKEEQLKLLKYHHQHQLQLQQKPLHQFNSGYNPPYQQRRNAIAPGLDNCYDATRRNSEIPISNRIFMPFAIKKRHSSYQVEVGKYILFKLLQTKGTYTFLCEVGITLTNRYIISGIYFLLFAIA